MTRYAKATLNKKQADDPSDWNSLKQIIKQPKDKPKSKVKKSKVVENIVSQESKSNSNDSGVVKKLEKKKKPKSQIVKEAIQSENNVGSDPHQKQGKGPMKFSKTDYEYKKKNRENVHKNRRMKMNPCFVCRSTQHRASECPKGYDKGVGVCFKCASTEHTTSTCPKRGIIQGFPHAKCFICNETGHLSRSCPDNPRGLYPNGGCCKECGAVEHFAKDCPTKLQTKQSHTIKLKTIKSSSNIEDDGMYELDDFVRSKNDVNPQVKHKPKVVKF